MGMSGGNPGIEMLLSRRSIRRFRDEDVPLDLVLRAIDVARYAPSAKNSQPWRFIVINDRDILDKLSRIHGGAIPLSRARVGIAVLANPDESPTSYMVDASLSAMYLWLALHCLGLGAVWIQTLRNISEVKRILNIVDDMVPIAILAVGWPAERPRVRMRKGLEEVTYLNQYGNKISNYRIP